MIERFSATDRAGLARPAGRDDAILLAAVRAIVDDVRARGWDALVEHSLRLDDAAPERIAVAPYAEEARRTLPADAIAAMSLARRNIENSTARPARAISRSSPCPGSASPSSGAR